MGTVYEAVDKERNARVALKTLRAMTAESLLRFKKEFRDFQDLSHPNLVSVGELFSDDGEWFFTMELIDGVNFLEYVRPGTFAERGHSFDENGPTAENVQNLLSSPRPFRASSGSLLNEARLRTALKQLALGLQALHEAGKVHRDIKPSNVLVSQHGRVVLLDFGLAQEIEHREHKSEVDIVGTIEYMAPEQAAARQVGPPADWYAVGVVLYEALTGQVPLSGPPIDVLMNKQRLDAPSPKVTNPAAPDDLAALCAELLRFNPGARPAGQAVLDRLGAREGRPHTSGSLSSFSTSSNFVGRERELEQLKECFDRSRQSSQTVLVHGESGLGKSSLVRHFIEQLKTSEPGVVALAGTCYERESVPFKAVDGLVDALSQYMRRLPKAEAAALLPRRAGLLAQVFPVLQRVEAVAEAPRTTEEVLDPQEQRSRLFAALRELLSRIADRHSLVLVIDDLQWADADSLALLGEVLRPPEAPLLLLIATVRSDEAESSANRRQSLREHLRGDMLMLTLGRMSDDEARTLAETLVGRAPGQAALDAAEIAREAAGHPLFIDELIRHAVAIGSPSRTSIQLEDALWARIAQLEPEARHILELVALASGKLLQSTAAQAASTSLADFTKHVALLRVAHLLRTTGMRGSDSVEPYHDRVRKAVVSHLDGSTLRRHHRRLAVALETSGQADPEALAIHWREAGEPVKSAHFGRLAAEKAERALAFDRAARFYEQCLGQIGTSSSAELRVRFAHALANAGRGRDAGLAYIAAAEQVSAAEALDLRRRAAEQLLRAGHIDEGLKILHTVLDDVGLKMARTPKRALASLLVQRAHIRLRGFRFHERKESQLSPEHLTRIDTCWSAAAGLSMVDTIRGGDFQARHLILALKAGEPYRVARALAMEAALIATGGSAAVGRAEALLNSARELANRLGHPHARGMTMIATGVAAFQAGRWREALGHVEEGEALLRDRCAGVAWEITTAQLFWLSALSFLGELDRMRQAIPTIVQAAEARGDLYAITHVRIRHRQQLYLFDGQTAEGRADLAAAMGLWAPPGYMAQHYYQLAAQQNLDLYEGRAEEAWQRLEGAWPALERSLFLRVQFIRVEALHLRARCALAVAQPGAAGESLRRRALADASRLSREGVPWAAALSLLIRAGVAAQEQSLEQARQLADEAARTFTSADMLLWSHVAGRRAGRSAECDAWMASRRIRDPERITAMLVPGFVD